MDRRAAATPPRAYRAQVSTQIMERGLNATLDELRTSLSLPASASFLYLAPEFNEYVAMDELKSLPAKCRVRVVMPSEAKKEAGSTAESGTGAEGA